MEETAPKSTEAEKQSSDEDRKTTTTTKQETSPTSPIRKQSSTKDISPTSPVKTQPSTKEVSPTSPVKKQPSTKDISPTSPIKKQPSTKDVSPTKESIQQPIAPRSITSALSQHTSSSVDAPLSTPSSSPTTIIAPVELSTTTTQPIDITMESPDIVQQQQHIIDTKQKTQSPEKLQSPIMKEKSLTRQAKDTLTAQLATMANVSIAVDVAQTVTQLENSLKEVELGLNMEAQTESTGGYANFAQQDDTLNVSVYDVPV
jgi:hypothetical protein